MLLLSPLFLDWRESVHTSDLVLVFADTLERPFLFLFFFLDSGGFFVLSLLVVLYLFLSLSLLVCYCASSFFLSSSVAVLVA